MILIVMILLGYGGCVARERGHYLTLAPCGMELSGIAYPASARAVCYLLSPGQVTNRTASMRTPAAGE